LNFFFLIYSRAFFEDLNLSDPPFINFIDFSFGFFIFELVTTTISLNSLDFIAFLLNDK